FLIHLIGLSTSLASVLLIFLWVQDEAVFDKFHKKDSVLYQVLENQSANGEIQTGFRTSGPLANAVLEQIPEVDLAVPVMESSWFPKFILSAGDESFVKATGQFVGKEYFDIFSFNLVTGNANEVLRDKFSIVVSTELALKLFNTSQGVIGKEVNLQLAHIEKTLMVTGVFENIPTNSSENFDLLLTYDWFSEISPAVFDWGNNGTNTYLVLNEGADLKSVNKKIQTIFEENQPNSGRTLFLKPYSDQYLYGKYENGKQAGGRVEYVRLFSLAALLILVVACINFMNLSTARAFSRIKEIGVKKVVGASKSILFGQYMAESFLLSLISMIVALLVVIIILPHFNLLTGKDIILSLNPTVISSLVGILLFTTILSGSYPAFYLSGFKPIFVLKNQLKISGGSIWFRKFLVVFQFSVSVFMILGVWVIYKQIEFIQTKNLGYNKDNVVLIEREGSLTGNLDPFLHEIKSLPGVKGASSMWGSITGGYSKTSDVNWKGKSPDFRDDFEIMGADYGLLELLDIKINQGRYFNRDYINDTSKIIFNQAGIDLMGLTDPIGQEVTVWGDKFEIIGVVEDFHFQTLHEVVKPLFIRLQPKNTSFIMLKLDSDAREETLAKLNEVYNLHNPGYPFEYKFLDEEYQSQYISEKRIGVLSQYFAVLAILISCLGLFGLTVFAAERRMKEIGIRKIVGSGTFGIMILLSRDFTKLVVIALLISLPLSYYLVEYWLHGFSYSIEITPIYFIGTALIVLFISWFTIGFQALKASRANPIHCLRVE
ncbi:MAG: ABC transporter permease, partial [Cyclobacteriaceae bacterium]|nr:ABC transporter permease [Cyclobacteriaceae bacterium]